MNPPKKFKVVTLGCRTNQYESAAYETQLRALGWTKGDDADLCIVNTCTVTEGADSSSRHQIRQLKRNNPRAKIIVTGCLAERLAKEIEAMEEVDLVVSNKDKEKLLEKIFPEIELPEFAIDQFGGHTRAFVKVQDGCNSFCTYCIIPYVRGRSRSRKINEILQEIKTLISRGYREVVLTGINIGDFDGEGDKNLADLVRAVDKLEGLERLRLSSIDPDEVDEKLLSAIIQGNKTCHSMHIVLQSGSNEILKRMNRKYTREIFFETIDRLKAAAPDFTFTTDIIVGFPGEKETDFEQTLDAMRKAQFAKVHMFPYSPRERTRAALYDGQIPQSVMQRRKQKALCLAEEIALDLREKYIDQELDVLLEGREGEYFTGHSDNFLKVLVPALGRKSNEIIRVKCIKNSPEGLFGEYLSCKLKAPCACDPSRPLQVLPA